MLEPNRPKAKIPSSTLIKNAVINATFESAEFHGCTQNHSAMDFIVIPGRKKGYRLAPQEHEVLRPVARERLAREFSRMDSSGLLLPTDWPRSSDG